MGNNEIKLQIDDNDTAMFAAIATQMSKDHVKADDDPWIGSPFQWLQNIPPRAKGTIGEKLVAAWASTLGFDVVRPKGSDADRIINGRRIEVKFSLLWESGIYKFQQIRDQEYDFVFCLAISPFEVHAWLIPKSVLKEHVIGHMGQHTGVNATDTSWFGFKPDEPFEWMKPYGSTLSEVADLIRKNGKGKF